MPGLRRSKRIDPNVTITPSPLYELGVWWSSLDIRLQIALGAISLMLGFSFIKPIITFICFGVALVFAAHYCCDPNKSASSVAGDNTSSASSSSSAQTSSFDSAPTQHLTFAPQRRRRAPSTEPNPSDMSAVVLNRFKTFCTEVGQDLSTWQQQNSVKEAETVKSDGWFVKKSTPRS